jgi:rSAM/selenodomain-associated transferase 2
MNPPAGDFISVVIPALNEADFIGATLTHLHAQVGGAPREIIVVDGGSTDATVAIAQEHGATVINAPRGRGSQLAAGARQATGQVLWFLHADTLPPPSAAATIRETLADPRVIGGSFRPQFDGGGRSARLLTWLYPHLGLLGLRYGDAGLFFRREVYEHAGGFAPHPIFEDLDLVRRVRRWGRLRALPDQVVTSSRRFEGRNFGLIFAGWTALQILFWLRVPPAVLGRLYPIVRQPAATAR